MRNCRRQRVVSRIGLKYCGGCSPRYDRVAAFEQIRQAAGDQIRFGSFEDPDLDGLLIMAGCPTACVDSTLLAPVPCRVVASLADAVSLIESLVMETDPWQPEKQDNLY